MPFQSGLSGIRFRFYNGAVVLCRAKMHKVLDMSIEKMVENRPVINMIFPGFPRSEYQISGRVGLLFPIIDPM